MFVCSAPVGDTRPRFTEANATDSAEWDRPDADQGPYASAMAAIETFRPGTRTGSLAPWRAGGLEGNHRTHYLIHASKILLFRQNHRRTHNLLKRAAGLL